MRNPVCTIDRRVWREGSLGHGRLEKGTRLIPEETAIALSYNGGTYAVMMATPRNLHDFAIGFSLTESIIESPDDIDSLETIDLADGIELRMWLKQARADRLSERRRHLAGPTGCGLCGIDSIAGAVRPAAIVAPGRSFSPREIITAVQAIPAQQTINIETRAVHAAAFWAPTRGVVSLREDVGRHNALDKLAGSLARDTVATGDGMVVLTSRVSVEMVQKTAAMGVPLIVAVSAPTALAVRTADAAGITLAAVARGDGFEIFSHPGRIVPEMAAQGSVDVA